MINFKQTAGSDTVSTNQISSVQLVTDKKPEVLNMAVAILPSTAIYPQRLFCRELFVIGQSK